jgi:hypothetical protein
VPSSLSNIIGGQLAEEYRFNFDAEPIVPIKDGQGRTVAFLVKGPLRFWVVKLHGSPVGITSFEEGKAYYVNALWADSEKQKWRNFSNYKRPR